jgi:hypothetical protein
VHCPRPGDPQPTESGREDDEIPGAVPRGGRDDQPIGPEPAGPIRESRCPRARPGELTLGDPELGRQPRPSQVDDREVAHLDPPQAPPLVGRIDRPIRRRPPLGPGGRRLERRVQRPRLAGPMEAGAGWRGPVGRRGRRVEAGLAVRRAAEAADRVQT